jgi:eukaryotic-like serine/threonine-protein kinase
MASLKTGTHFGPFEILGPVGTGGMGEVYRARDTRLDRTVAIKTLPAAIAQDSDRKQRFEREAKAIAGLNHPHICILHDVGEQDGTPYLVMEFVEGETLADCLKHGPLPFELAMRCAIEIADALDKAHTTGIVHRDIKPGNIMMTKSGVKLLDFGLAKLTENANVTNPTTTSLPTKSELTEAGIILGTLQYMSPEQLEGKDADARADIFAFGVVLYEMLTGRKTFEGKTQASLIAAILEHEPAPISTLQPLTPRAIEHVVQGCLAKDRESRWQNARDVLGELRWIAAGVEVQAGIKKGVSRTRERVAWSLLLVTLVIVAVISIWTFNRSIVQEGPVWFSILPPDSISGIGSEPAISPDSKSIVFRARNSHGQTTLWVRFPDSPSARELPGTEKAMLPFWSPDSRSIAFFTDAPGKLKRIDVNGGAPQELADAPNARGGTWGTDGSILFYPIPGALRRVAASGGAVTPLAVQDLKNFSGYPSFLSDGKHFLLSMDFTEATGLYVGSLESRDLKKIADFRSRAEYHDGYLLFVNNGSLYAQSFDDRHVTVSGDAIRLADNIGVMWGPQYAFSANDKDLVYSGSGSYPETQVVVFDRSGRNLGVVGQPGEFWGLVLSPDEKQIAVERWDHLVKLGSIWLMELATGNLNRFAGSNTIGAGTPVWSPKGDRILFWGGGDSPAIKTIRDERTTVMKDSKAGWFQDWSADGQYVLFEVNDPKTNFDLWVLPASGEAKAAPYLESTFADSKGRFSPSVHWVVYTSDESGREEVYIQSFPKPGNKKRISVNGGTQPEWRKDGHELYFLAPDHKLMAVSITESASGLEHSTPQPLFEAPELCGDPGRHQYAALSNGQKFLFNARSEHPIPEAITVLRNWRSLLKK